METYAIMLGFVINNLFWMIFFQTQKDGKDFVTEIKQVVPKFPSFKKKKDIIGVESTSPKEAAKILKNLVENK